MNHLFFIYMGHIVKNVLFCIGGVGGFNNHNGSTLLSIILSPTSIYMYDMEVI